MIDLNGKSVVNEKSKIYIDTNTNKVYRWTGTTFFEISSKIEIPDNIATTEYVDNAIAKITETTDIIISGSDDDGIWTLIDSTDTGTDRIWMSPTVIDNHYSAYKIYWSKQIDPVGCWVLCSFDDILAANQNEFGLENPWDGTWSNNITVKCGSKYATTEYVDNAINKVNIDTKLANKADLVGGKVPTDQLPTLLKLGETTTTAFPGNRGKQLETTLSGKADLVNGKVPLNQLPDNLGGSSLELGDTAGTAFPGDRGKALEDKLCSTSFIVTDPDNSNNPMNGIYELTRGSIDDTSTSPVWTNKSNSKYYLWIQYNYNDGGGFTVSYLLMDQPDAAYMPYFQAIDTITNIEETKYPWDNSLKYNGVGAGSEAKISIKQVETYATTEYVKQTISESGSDTISIIDNKIHIKFADQSGISVTSSGVALDINTIITLLGLDAIKTDIATLKSQLSGVNELLTELNGESL